CRAAGGTHGVEQADHDDELPDEPAAERQRTHHSRHDDRQDVDAQSESGTQDRARFHRQAEDDEYNSEAGETEAGHLLEFEVVRPLELWDACNRYESKR